MSHLCYRCKKEIPHKKYMCDDCNKRKREKRNKELINSKQQSYRKQQQEIYKESKILGVTCKDCKKPTKGTYRCEKCRGIWNAKHGISTYGSSVNEDWLEF